MLSVVLTCIALILFIFAAVGIPSRVNLTAAGLAFTVGALLSMSIGR